MNLSLNQIINQAAPRRLIIIQHLLTSIAFSG